MNFDTEMENGMMGVDSIATITGTTEDGATAAESARTTTNNGENENTAAGGPDDGDEEAVLQRFDEVQSFSYTGHP